MLVIRDSPPCLWQWDINRQVMVMDAPPGAFIHFALVHKSCEAVVVEPTEEAGVMVADIPNLLLQDGGDVAAWVSDDGRTVDSAVFRVKARPRPSDYVYEPTNVVTIQKIKEQVEEIVAQIKLANDYESLENLPSINGVVVRGALSLDELGAVGTADAVTDDDIDKMFAEGANENDMA